MVFSAWWSQGNWISYIGYASLVAQTLKNLPAMQETWVQSRGVQIPQRRQWQPTLENPMDRGAWWGYSPWGYKELGITEGLTHTHTLTYTHTHTHTHTHKT